ncbi:MAG: hypothetical protein ACK5Y0_05020 [Pseudomonadota bacterium]
MAVRLDGEPWNFLCAIALFPLLLTLLAASTTVAAQPSAPSGLHPPVTYPYPHASPYAPPPRWSDPFGWEAPQVDGFDVLYVDDAPLMLSHYVPAGGPTQRHTSRPGAWYTAVFLPLAPQRPVQIWVAQRLRTHELRVRVLDASPTRAASVVLPLPLASARSAGRSAQVSAPVMLPAASQADGVFLLIEQWSVAGDAPGAIWLQARSRLQRVVDPSPWWHSRAPEAGAPPPGSGLAPPPPPSPLTAPRDAGGVIELPISRRLHTP